MTVAFEGMKGGGTGGKGLFSVQSAVHDWKPMGHKLVIHFPADSGPYAAVSAHEHWCSERKQRHSKGGKTAAASNIHSSRGGEPGHLRSPLLP